MRPKKGPIVPGQKGESDSVRFFYSFVSLLTKRPMKLANETSLNDAVWSDV